MKQNTQPQHVQFLNVHHKLETSSSCDLKLDGKSLFMESHALSKANGVTNIGTLQSKIDDPVVLVD